MSTNGSVVVFKSAQRNATTISEGFQNFHSRGLTLIVDMTAFAGGGAGVVFWLQAYDPASTKWVDIISAGVFAVQTTPVIIYPADANNNPCPLPPVWRIRAVHGDGLNYTYSVGALLHA